MTITTVSAYAEQFASLDRLLYKHRQLWKPRAFFQPELPWQQHYPALNSALLKLNQQQVMQLDQSFAALCDFFAEWISDCQSLRQASQLPTLKIKAAELSPFEQVDIPGRKWHQASRFAGALTNVNSPIVDWCSGKGHLARILNLHHQQPVHCLELDQQLCQQGTTQAKRQQLAINFYPHDVLTPLPHSLCQQGPCYHTALHACGDLHRAFLSQTTERQIEQLAWAPCCYHKTNAKRYQALSIAGQQSTLTLSRDDLRLAVEETVTAGRRNQQQRQQELNWRLAFDCLQRSLSHRGYQPLPSIKKSVLNGDFADFCRWGCDYLGLQLPSNTDWSYFLCQGQQRLQQVLRSDLLRHLFRRPLELWLVLDQLLFLEQQGYQVSIGEFCDRQTTPRNILMTAEKLIKIGEPPSPPLKMNDQTPSFSHRSVNTHNSQQVSARTL